MKKSIRTKILIVYIIAILTIAISTSCLIYFKKNYSKYSRLSKLNTYNATIEYIVTAKNDLYTVRIQTWPTDNKIKTDERLSTGDRITFVYDRNNGIYFTPEINYMMQSYFDKTISAGVFTGISILLLILTIKIDISLKQHPELNS